MTTQGGSTETPTPQGGTAPTPPAPAVVDVGEQIARGLQNLIARQGGADRAAELLYNENREHRARIRELEGQRPAEGSVVLTPEQAQAWTAYQQLGPDPQALATRLREGGEAVERETARTVATVSGANADALADFLRLTGLRTDVRDVPAQGDQPARRAVHLLSAEGQDQGELRAYAQQHRPALMPALFPTPAPQGGVALSGQAGVTTPQGQQNVIAAALQGHRPTPANGQRVVSAFDFAPTASGGTA